jgi:hypothetical protein
MMIDLREVLDDIALKADCGPMQYVGHDEIVITKAMFLRLMTIRDDLAVRDSRQISLHILA